MTQTATQQYGEQKDNLSEEQKEARLFVDQTLCCISCVSYHVIAQSSG